MHGIDRSLDEAIRLLDAGRLAEAERLLHDILDAEPEHFGSLHCLGVLRARQGRVEEAAGLMSRALARNPNSAEAHNDAGCALHALGRHQEALACFDRALVIDPAYVEPHYNRGTVLQALGQHEGAIAAYEAALAIAPEVAEAHYNLGAALQVLGQYEAAAGHFEQAVAIAPGYVRARVALGIVLQTLGRHREAIPHFEQALTAEPALADVHHRLGTAWQLQGRHAAAIACYEQALALDPTHADAHNNLGLTLQAANRHAEAIAHHERALGMRPGFAAAHNNLALAMQALNRHDEAIEHYRQAIAAEPGHALRRCNMGVALQEIGRLDEACGAFEQAIRLAPRCGRFYRHLADCRQFTPGDPAVAAMEALAAERRSLPEDDRRQLLFALAKAYADLGEYDSSFEYLLEGNALKRQQIGYDEAGVLGQFRRIEAVFTKGLIRRRSGIGHPSPVPVFIVGMPRSGTTLIEQTLAGHPQVFGAGELADLGNAAWRLGGFPEVIESLPDEALRRFGAGYVEGISARAPAAMRITDKMPLNFLFVGLIHLALPKARIIHAVRDAVDTCLSCFATLFTGDHRVAYRLDELGRYYRAYTRLMEHWRRVLPAGVMFEVRYEDMVTQLEPCVGRILAHCGLGWDGRAWNSIEHGGRFGLPVPRRCGGRSTGAQLAAGARMVHGSARCWRRSASIHPTQEPEWITRF
jgi:tetratricopeptide (TPR) repeat protein